MKFFWCFKRNYFQQPIWMDACISFFRSLLSNSEKKYYVERVKKICHTDTKGLNNWNENNWDVKYSKSIKEKLLLLLKLGWTTKNMTWNCEYLLFIMIFILLVYITYDYLSKMFLSFFYRLNILLSISKQCLKYITFISNHVKWSSMYKWGTQCTFCSPFFKFLNFLFFFAKNEYL